MQVTEWISVKIMQFWCSYTSNVW